MAERPAVNVSPLIFLARAGLLDLLQLASPEVVVPAPVAEEISRRGRTDPAARALASLGWVIAVDAPEIPAVIQSWDLGPGESAVLSWPCESGSRGHRRRSRRPPMRGRARPARAGHARLGAPRQAARPAHRGSTGTRLASSFRDVPVRPSHEPRAALGRRVGLDSCT